MVVLLILHIISLRRTFDEVYNKIIQGYKTLFSYGFCIYLNEATIWPSLNDNPIRSKGDMERT